MPCNLLLVASAGTGDGSAANRFSVPLVWERAVVAMLGLGYERDKVGEVMSFTGLTSVGREDKLLSYTDLFPRFGEALFVVTLTMAENLQCSTV
ncbi:hypothetical protein UY3_05768 [Chelonia mydas]|uniref:Uncharacterized protein n=1 Tax=Chelonia mydas TaxID=8469 RepID=M7BIP2_CHEMY|nr:hypothetical protein UY3_05768 [Chelonia mydas]